MVDRPEVAKQQSAPRTVFDSGSGFVIGVMLASLIVIIKALADTTIYLPEDIERLSGVTVLSQIPQITVSDSEYEYWKLTNGGVVHYED